MNKNFGAWYRIANFEPEHEMLQMRWEGISKYIEQGVTSEDIINLVRMFFGLQIASDFSDSFSSCFLESDGAFNTQNRFELSVLAGATLRELLEHNDTNNNLIYLLLISTAFCNKNLSVPEIQEEIVDLFNNACISTREDMVQCEESKISIPSLKTINGIFQADTVPWDQQIIKALSSYFKAMNNTLTELSDANSKYERYTSICSEDSQILWWLIGKWSNSFERPFSDFNAQEAAIYVGKELADLVTNLPGPYSSKAVLNQALSDCKKGKVDIIFSDAINSLSYEWKESLTGSCDTSMLEGLTPIMDAISLSLKVDNKEGWFPLFKKLTSNDPCEIKCKAIELAYQIYVECLCIKALEEDA